jgi:hypothetical protein
MYVASTAQWFRIGKNKSQFLMEDCSSIGKNECIPIEGCGS